jgi:hypothetical protein
LNRVSGHKGLPEIRELTIQDGFPAAAEEVQIKVEVVE